MKIILSTLIIFCAFSIIAQEESMIDKYAPKRNLVLKARLLPIVIGSSAGIGIERQIGKSSSILVLFNAISYSVGSDAPTNTTLSLNPEYRYYFNEFSVSSLFAGSFIELGNHSKSLGGEIDPENHTHYKGGNFLGVGILVGKNIKLGKRLYIDSYFGPKIKLQKEEILERNGSQITELSQVDSKLGVRFGLNLNYLLSK